jgi:hypothetical protein
LQDVLQIIASQAAAALNPGISQVTVLNQGISIDEPVGETDGVIVTTGSATGAWG